jgi:Icc protein
MPTLPESLLTFVHISDTHVHSDPKFTGRHVDFTSRNGVNRLVDAINALPFAFDFVLHTGDIMTDPTEEREYMVARYMIGSINAPVYYLSGNHDKPRFIQSVMMGRESSEVTPHLDYAFEHNGVQVICLDSSVDEHDTHIGRLEESQLAWLDSQIDPADTRPLVIGIHHHPLPLLAPWLDNIVLENGLELHKRLVPIRDRVRGVFYGHIHENICTVRDGIPYYSVLSGWFQTRTYYGQTAPASDPMIEPGFNVVTITAEDTFVRRYRVPLR